MEAWMLYHRTKEPKIFYSMEDRQAAIDSGQWRDAHEDFKEVGSSQTGNTPGKLSKTAVMRMNAEGRAQLLADMEIVMPEGSKREAEIAAILEKQDEGTDS